MALFKKLLTFQIILVLYSICAEAEKIMRPKFKDVKLWSDPAYVSHTITFDANDPHVNFTLNVLQDAANVDLHTQFRITQKEDPAYFFTANSSLNLCRLLNWRAKSPIGNLIHNYLQEYGKLIESCPIGKGHYSFHKHLNPPFQGQYFLHKIWIPEDTATAVIPELDFEIHFSAYVLDADKKRTMVIDDHITGEGVIQDVTNVKHGILAMLPKAG